MLENRNELYQGWLTIFTHVDIIGHVSSQK